LSSAVLWQASGGLCDGASAYVAVARPADGLRGRFQSWAGRRAGPEGTCRPWLTGAGGRPGRYIHNYEDYLANEDAPAPPWEDDWRDAQWGEEAYREAPHRREVRPRAPAPALGAGVWKLGVRDVHAGVRRNRVQAALPRLRAPPGEILPGASAELHCLTGTAA
jgi:hypothetical protein